MPVRPIRRSDYAALNRLHRQVGWPERSQAGWRWLEENPARIEIDAPMGWVVVDEHDEPQAMLGNLIQRFRRGDQVLHGATGFSIIVPPERKGASRSLIKALLAQPNLFARYTLNANPKAAPLYPLFGLKPFPTETPKLKLSWIVDKGTALKGRLLRSLLGHVSAETAARIGRHWGERLMNPRLFRPGQVELPLDVVVLRDVGRGSAYARFWGELAAEGRLVADRGPEMLDWRLSDPDQTLSPILLGLKREGRIVGTLLAQPNKTSLIEAPCIDIIDIAVLKSAPEAVEILARAVIDNARALGAAKVRLQVTTPEMLDRLGALTPKARREGGWGHCHALIADEALARDWAPTPYDGDYAVCARPVPLPKAWRAAAAADRPEAGRRPDSGGIAADKKTGCSSCSSCTFRRLQAGEATPDPLSKNRV